MDDHFDIYRVFEISKFDIARLTCFFTVFLKNKNSISKIRISKFTDYAALNKEKNGADE